MNVRTRIGSAAACVALVTVLARQGIAEAIIARGDEAARSGRLTAAATYYDRARAIGGDSFDEVERFALLALLEPRGKVSPSAIRTADAFLKTNERSAPGYFDRGLIEWRTGAYAASAEDFGRASTLGHDPRASAFAKAARHRALWGVRQ